MIHNEIGIAQFGVGDFEEALAEFADLLAIYQDQDFTPGVIQSLVNIGSAYFALGELDSSLEAFEEALEVQRSYIIDYFGKKRDQARYSNETLKEALIGVSDTFCNLAYVYKATDSASTARFLMKEAFTIHKVLAGNIVTEPMREIMDVIKLFEPNKDTCEL